MKSIFLLLVLLFSSLFAAEIDRSTSSFEMRKKKQVEVFDFSGEFPNLENIDIDARRKKRVEFYLTGDYPLLEALNYEGSFGLLVGELTGNFPELTNVNFLCTSCAMNFDLSGQWHKNCEITIRGMKEDVIIRLPEEVGIVVHTKTAPGGKVVANDLLKKQGWGMWNKTYVNEQAEEAEVVLIFNIETTEGNIILN